MNETKPTAKFHNVLMRKWRKKLSFLHELVRDLKTWFSEGAYQKSSRVSSEHDRVGNILSEKVRSKTLMDIEPKGHPPHRSTRALWWLRLRSGICLWRPKYAVENRDEVHSNTVVKHNSNFYSFLESRTRLKVPRPIALPSSSSEKGTAQIG